MIAALLALALGSIDPCAPIAAAAPPDAATAALYREAASLERAAGHGTTAAIAYARAAALDPADTASREALRALCAAGPATAGSFEAGLRRLEAGDLRGAAASFEVARRAGDRSAALLEGVSLYRLGDDRAAEAPLREAAQAPEHQDLATFYLGLAALRSGQASSAASFFDATRSNGALGDMSATLARMARRDGRLVLSVTAQAGYDSNVALLPKGSSGGTSGGGMMGGGAPSALMMDGDGLYDLAGAALWRPLGPSGPYARAGGTVHRYARRSAYDLGSGEAAGGWQWAVDGHGVLGELSYAMQRYGGAPFLQAGRLLGTGWLTRGDWTWSASYAGSVQRYADAFRPYDGSLQRLELKAAWTLAPRTWLGLDYGVAKVATRSSLAASLDHGPRAELRAVLSSSWRVGLDAGLTLRRAAEVDPALGARPKVTFLDGAAFAEADLADHWTMRLSVTGRDTSSNVPSAEYAKLQAMLALAYVFGM